MATPSLCSHFCSEAMCLYNHLGIAPLRKSGGRTDVCVLQGPGKAKYGRAL